MSHFAVAVLTDENTTVDELLSPFDENITVEEYMVHTREELIRKAREELEEIKNTNYAEYLKDPAAYLEKRCHGDVQNRHYIFLSTEFEDRYKENDEEILKRELSYYDEDMVDADGNAYSTYNPDSKWDWYSIGGRFSDMLLSIDSDTWADELPAPDINLLGMEQEESNSS